jgi:hypothetical protein
VILVSRWTVSTRGCGRSRTWAAPVRPGPSTSAFAPVMRPGEDGSRYDPHWWHDPRNVEAVVPVVRDALTAPPIPRPRHVRAQRRRVSRQAAPARRRHPRLRRHRPGRRAQARDRP